MNRCIAVRRRRQAHKYPDHQLRPSEGSNILGRRDRTFEPYRVDEREDGDEERDDEVETSESDEDHGGSWTNDMPGEPEKDDPKGIVVEDEKEIVWTGTAISASQRLDPRRVNLVYSAPQKCNNGHC
jgi:hypothetical protein